jgi:CAAX protease family protein
MVFMETSKTSGQSTASSRSLRQVMRQHPLFFFFLMAYVFSWIVLIPYVLSVWVIMPKFFSLPLGAAAFNLNPFLGPALAAFIMTGITEGKAGVLRLLHRFIQWRAGWQWYLFILLGIPALLLLGIIVLPGALASFHGLPSFFLVSYSVMFVVYFFLSGPLGEEPGWRGFALPRMQPRYGPLWGTLLLGILWGFWHLPHFLTPAQHGGPGTSFATFLTNFPIFVLFIMAMSIIFTWVFNHTRGSLFIAILLHTGINTSSTLIPLFPVPIVIGTDLAALIGFGVPALLIVILTRGRLGYQPGQEQP